MTDHAYHTMPAHGLARQTWLRGLFMLLFAVISRVAELVLLTVAVLQFLWSLATGQSNARLRAFGESLSRYLYQVFRFLTFDTEDKPFPFSDWPGAAPSGLAEAPSTGGGDP